MATTYTDLKNKLKETINVDYKNRSTNQLVKFKNEQNEYWGTLHGTIQAENVSISGGVVTDSLIEGGIIHNAKLCSDLGIIDLGNLQTEVESIARGLTETNDKLSDETDERKRADDDLRTAIISASGSSTRISADIEYLSGAIGTLSIDVFDAIDSVSNNLNGKLITVSSDLSTALGIEISNRKAADNSLCTYAKQISGDIAAEIAQVSSALDTKFNDDKHFEIRAINTGSAVLHASDWTVNVLTSLTLFDGEVRKEGTGEGNGIGKVLRNKTIPRKLSFKTYDTLPSEFLEALEPGRTYELQLNDPTTTRPGYLLTFTEDDEGNLAGQLKSAFENYYELQVNGLVIGTIANALLDSAGNIISGFLNVDGPGEFYAFNCSQNFNRSYLSVINVTAEGHNRISYIGNNLFYLDKNLSVQDFVDVLKTVPEGEVLGTVFKKDVSRDADSLKSVAIQIDANKVQLNANAGLSAEFEYRGMPSILCCNETPVDAIAFSVYEKHIQYAYVGASLDTEFAQQISVVLSANENTTLDEMPPASIAYIDLTNSNIFRKHKTVYPLATVDGKLFSYRNYVDEHNYITIELDANTREIDIIYEYKTDGINKSEKHVTLQKQPLIWNSNPYVLTVESIPVDLTFHTGSESREVPEKRFQGEAVKHTGKKYECGLTVGKLDDSLLKIAIPDKRLDTTLSRVLEFALKIDSDAHDKLKLQFVHADERTPVEYFAHSSDGIVIPANKFVHLRLEEVRGDVFSVIDYSNSELVDAISTIDSNLYDLSTQTSLVSAFLSGQISADHVKLENVIDALAGNLVYKSDLSLDIDLPDNRLSTLFAANLWIHAHDDRLPPAYFKQYPLSAGFCYSTVAADKAQRFDFEGLDLASGDLIVVKNDAAVSALTRDDVLTIDAFDADAAHIADLVNLSNDLLDVIDGVSCMLSTADAYLSAQTSAIVQTYPDAVLYQGTLKAQYPSVEHGHVHLSSLIAGTFGTAPIKKGTVYHLSAVQDHVFDCTETSCYLGENDFMLINHDSEVDQLTFGMVDIIRNGDSEYSELKQEIKCLASRVTSCETSCDVLAAQICDVQHTLTSGYFKLSGNNVISGTNEFIDQTIFSEISVAHISTDYLRTFSILVSDQLSANKGAFVEHVADQLSANRGTFVEHVADQLSVNSYAIMQNLSANALSADKMHIERLHASDIHANDATARSLHVSELTSAKHITQALTASAIQVPFNKLYESTVTENYLSAYLQPLPDAEISKLADRINTIILSADLNSSYVIANAAIKALAQSAKYIGRVANCQKTISNEPTYEDITDVLDESICKLKVTTSGKPLSQRLQELDADLAVTTDRVNDLSASYDATLSGIDRAQRADPDILTDNLMLTDISAEISPIYPHQHKQYFMTLENGTIVLKPIN